MTPDTAVIRERLEKATKGPWKIGAYDKSCLYIPLGTAARLCRVDGIHEAAQANADFIAHAPTDIDALLAENERLRIRVDEAERAWRAHRDSALRWEKLYRDATGDTVQEPDNDNIKF